MNLGPRVPRVKALSRFVHKGAIFLTFMYRKEFYNQSFECNFFNVSDTLIDLQYISRITGLQDDNKGYSVKYFVLKTSFWQFCKWDLIWRRTKHKDNFIKRGRWETGPIHAIFPIIRVLVWTMPINNNKYHDTPTTRPFSNKVLGAVSNLVFV